MPTKVRRVVTGHDASGKAVVLMDGEAKKVKVRMGNGPAMTMLWVTDETPADISGDVDAAERDIGIPPPPNGSIFRIVEFPPEKEVKNNLSSEKMMEEMGLTPIVGAGEKPRHPGMHRTSTIDYAIVISGELDMLLDDSEIHVKAGDVVVQRGSNHAWVNRGDTPCSIAFILIDAKG